MPAGCNRVASICQINSAKSISLAFWHPPEAIVYDEGKGIVRLYINDIEYSQDSILDETGGPKLTPCNKLIFFVKFFSALFFLYLFKVLL